MQKATFQLETLACPSCLQKIESALKGLNGIDQESVNVSFNSSKAKVDFDSDKISIEEIQKSIEALGYPVLKAKSKAL